MGFWAFYGPDQRALHYLAVSISYPSRKEKNDDPKGESEISPDPSGKAATCGQGVGPPPWLKGSKR